MEPSLHSGINAAVLLIAAGKHFDDSEELQLIGEAHSTSTGSRGTYGEGKEGALGGKKSQS